MPSQFDSLLKQGTIGLIVVDHGSRRAESNESLDAVVSLFQQTMQLPIVEPAHMELAEPSIATAFRRVVRQGVRMVVVFPYFLAPGRHWSEDIPRLARQAAEQHENIPFLVTAPLGIHSLMCSIMKDRIEHCLAHAAADAEDCEVCTGTDACAIRNPSADPWLGGA